MIGKRIEVPLRYLKWCSMSGVGGGLPVARYPIVRPGSVARVPVPDLGASLRNFVLNAVDL